MRRFLQEILDSKFNDLLYHWRPIFVFQDYSTEENVKVCLNLQILKGFEKVLSYICPLAA